MAKKAKAKTNGKKPLPQAPRSTPAASGKAPKKAAPGAVKSSPPKPATNHSQAAAPKFEDAKSAAIDNLIRLIEDAERRLTAAKRASTFEELHRLTR